MMLGNITSYSNTSGLKASNLSYTYNTSTNKLTGVSGNGSAGYDFSQAGSYDNRGNVTHNGMRGFIYNLANQMTDSGSNHYVYDGYNRRVKTQDSKGTSYSMYSQSGRLLYREVNGNPVSYIYLGDKLVAKDGVMLASSDSKMHYKPFGDSIEQAKDEVGYTGHKFDTDLGLSYMQARYYDPVIGRFYSNDPVGFTGEVDTFNRYSYVANNPYKYVDPSGMCSQAANASADTKCQNTANLTTSKNGENFITKNEGGSKLTVYQDTALHDTVGVGHKVVPKDNLKQGDQITQTESDTLFSGDLATAEKGVKSLVGSLDLSQNEFDALTDLTFNVGVGTLKNKSPALNTAIKNGDYKEMGRQLTYTKDSAGNRQGGLVTRSKDRTVLFNKK